MPSTALRWCIRGSAVLAISDALNGLRQFDSPALGPVYRGKVRDCYWGRREGLIVTSDRISAFDVVFPQIIPRKGEVLQSMAAHFLSQAQDILPTHLLEVLDPNVMLVRRAQPLPIELVIRGYLTGSAWRDYQAGKLQLSYGLTLPPGMNQHQRLEQPLITPTSKETSGHDRPLHPSQAELLAGGAKRWQEIVEAVRALFAQGQSWARQRGLELVDAKYEMGLIDDQLVLIDELHTPDSSRYWTVPLSQPPQQLSKEFFREWLLGQNAQGVIEIPPEIQSELSHRYQQLHQQLLGFPLPAAVPGDPVQRIGRVVEQHLQLRGLP